MQHIFHSMQTPSVRQIEPCLPKSFDVNSTCQHSFNDNSQEHPDPDDPFTEPSLHDKTDLGLRRHSSYQVYKPSFACQRYSLRENDREQRGNYQRAEAFLYQENLNLKAQNQYLLQHVIKLRACNLQLKEKTARQAKQTLKAMEEIEMQIRRSLEIEKVMNELVIFENKVKAIQPTLSSSCGESSEYLCRQ